MALETLNDNINIEHLNLDQPNRRTSNPVAELFEELSRRTWSRLQHARDFGVSQGEETITDINLLDIAIADLEEVKLWKCPKSEEPKFGIDWWWLIGNDHIGWRSYMVQAKKLDLSRGRYLQLDHSVGERKQIEILEEQARLWRAFPLYCFYNFAHIDTSQHKAYLHCSSTPKDLGQLGCTVTPLRLIKDITAIRYSRPSQRSFEYIHFKPETIPWRCLVKCNHAAQAYDEARNVLDGFRQPITYSTYAHIPAEVRVRFERTRNQSETTEADLGPVNQEHFVFKKMAMFKIPGLHDGFSEGFQRKEALPVTRDF